MSGSDLTTDLTPHSEKLICMSSTELDRAIDDMTIRDARATMRNLEQEIQRIERLKLSVVDVRQKISKAVRTDVQRFA